MKVTKKNFSIILEALSQWRELNHIDENQFQSLKASLEPIPFDWKKIAQYSLWIGIICLFLSISAIIADQFLIELIQKIFHSSHLFKMIVFIFMAVVFYGVGTVQKRKMPERIYSLEALYFLGLLSTAGAVVQYGELVGKESGHFSLLFLLSCLVYGVQAFFFNSNLIWIFCLLSLGAWMGAETGYLSGWGAYFLGMNYPVRFFLLGFVLSALALLLERKYWFKKFSKSSLAIGLLYLFISLWLMSIFGNYGDIHDWQRSGPLELFPWALLFGIVALGAIYHGTKCDHAMTRGFGLTFLFINLYTRYFEYFWNGLHKAIFFFGLGVSFWVLGTKAEDIWNLKYKKTIDD